MGEGGWWCGVGVRCLVLSAGSCHPVAVMSSLWGTGCSDLTQLITSRVVRPDPTDPTETDPDAIVRSLRPELSGRDTSGSSGVAHVEQPAQLPRCRGRGVCRSVERECRSRWAFLVIARRSPLSRESKRPPASAKGLRMSASYPIVGLLLLGLVGDRLILHLRVNEAPTA